MRGEAWEGERLEVRGERLEVETVEGVERVERVERVEEVKGGEGEGGTAVRGRVLAAARKVSGG